MCQSGQKVSTDVVKSAALQQPSDSLTEARGGAADVFGVILACAVARLSFLTQRLRRKWRQGGASQAQSTLVSPEGEIRHLIWLFWVFFFFFENYKKNDSDDDAFSAAQSDSSSYYAGCLQP